MELKRLRERYEHALKVRESVPGWTWVIPPCRHCGKKLNSRESMEALLNHIGLHARCKEFYNQELVDCTSPAMRAKFNALGKALHKRWNP